MPIRTRSAARPVALLVLLVSAATGQSTALPNGEATMPDDDPPAAEMLFGVDDAGKRHHIYQDPAMREAFEAVGFDFLMHHLHGQASEEDLEQLDTWARSAGAWYVLNQENVRPTPGAGDQYRRPGWFFQPTAPYVQRALQSDHFLGFCYDEAEHWATNGIGITGGASVADYRPHFHDAEGESLAEAYEGNLHNLLAMTRTHYRLFASLERRPGGGPVVMTEQVFPILMPLFARAGLVPAPKYMKESVTPVFAAVTLGAVKQYGVPYWACLDLWGIAPAYPGHAPEELRSAMLFAYWTGADAAYVENFNYRDSLYRVVDGRAELNAHGRMAQWFRREYLPNHPRGFTAGELMPEIAIVRFPDSDWGQRQRSYIRENLYGASNLVPDEQTRYWLGIWHVLSHGTIPPTGLTWHADYTIAYRFFFPANNVVVYDHLASDPALYGSVRLVLLAGKFIAPETMRTLETRVAEGLTVVTPSHLAPEGMPLPPGTDVQVYPRGAGRWIVTDRVTGEAARALLAPYLGRPDELRYRFGDREVVFTAPEDPNRIEVTIRPAAPRP